MQLRRTWQEGAKGGRERRQNLAGVAGALAGLEDECGCTCMYILFTLSRYIYHAIFEKSGKDILMSSYIYMYICMVRGRVVTDPCIVCTVPTWSLRPDFFFFFFFFGDASKEK